MGSIGPLELAIVLAIALVVLGPSKLPEVGRSVGRGMREFRESVSGDRPRDDDDGGSLEPGRERPRHADRP